MSSFTVSIESTSSVLKSTLFPALYLHGNKDWEVALLDFTTYNSIPNVTENVNNQLHYYRTKSKEGTFSNLEVATFQTGSYEIDDIDHELKKQLGAENIDIKANNSLLRVQLKSNYYIDFTQPQSIGSLLGFLNSSDILPPGKTHIATNTVNIIKVNTINITCNIIRGSYKNGSDSHILHTFYPEVSPGFKIVEKPHNLVYLPVSTSVISDIELNVLDQDDNLVDFRGENISIRLHIKPSV